MLTRRGLRPRPLSTTSFEVIDASQEVDEEELEHYKPSRFYPVHISDIYESRYQVLAKLGYGSCSTVWLSRDLIEKKYVALKVCISKYPSIGRESAAYARLREVYTGPQDSLLVPSSLDEFELKGVEGPHRCFVFEPLTIDLQATRAYVRPFDESLFKTVAFYVFRALEFLHTKAEMVHGDIRPENFCLTAIDQSTFSKLELLESVRPSPPKVCEDRSIYCGFGQVIPEGDQLLGIPVLCDSGEARFGEESYNFPIQPFMYQAPEVVFDIPWSYPADIWNAGVMLWDLFEKKRLLSAAYKAQPSYPQLVAEMVGLMGTPPPSFLLRSPADIRQIWFNDAGEWSFEHEVIKVPNLTMEEEKEGLEGCWNR